MKRRGKAKAKGSNHIVGAAARSGTSGFTGGATGMVLGSGACAGVAACSASSAGFGIRRCSIPDILIVLVILVLVVTFLVGFILLDLIFV